MAERSGVRTAELVILQKIWLTTVRTASLRPMV
jgi:hypothetical protein